MHILHILHNCATATKGTKKTHTNRKKKKLGTLAKTNLPPMIGGCCPDGVQSTSYPGQMCVCVAYGELWRRCGVKGMNDE